MECKIYIFGRVYSLCFGYKTPWFEQIYFFSVIREWHDEDKMVSWAELVFHS